MREGRKHALATAVVVVVGYGYFMGKRGSLTGSGHSYGVEPNYDSMRTALHHQDEKIAMLEEALHSHVEAEKQLHPPPPPLPLLPHRAIPPPPEVASSSPDSGGGAALGGAFHCEAGGLPTRMNECRRDAVRGMMNHAWAGYKKHAWGNNELDPIKNGAYTGSAGLFAGQSGATIIDSLDTLYIMNMTDELSEAREWVQHDLNFDVNSKGSVFEISIRYFAGLLSAYALTKDALYKEKALDIGTRLAKAFNTKTGVPYGVINLKTGSGSTHWTPCSCGILSEMGSLTMEFRYLSKITGDPKFEQAVDKAMGVMMHQDLTRHSGLFPFYVNLNSGALSGSSYRFGAMSDSFYEYLFKDWRYKGGLRTYNKGRKPFDSVMDSAKEKLFKTSKDGYLYVGDIENGRFVTHMEHLSCFLPGTMAMASQGAKDEASSKWYLETAEGLARTCHDGYNRTVTKLGPELMEFDRGGGAEANPDRAFYWLRPETIESFFYLWRHTKKQMYRDWAWDIAVAIEKECKCGSGYCGLKDVRTPGNFHNVQESYFLAETLKYLYLIFSDDGLVDLDNWVFNTEAHPLPVQR